MVVDRGSRRFPRDEKLHRGEGVNIVQEWVCLSGVERFRRGSEESMGSSYRGSRRFERFQWGSEDSMGGLAIEGREGSRGSSGGSEDSMGGLWRVEKDYGRDSSGSRRGWVGQVLLFQKVSRLIQFWQWVI